MSKHSKARVYLSDDDKATIRKSNLTAEQLATSYGVAINTIYVIIRNRKIKK